MGKGTADTFLWRPASSGPRKSLSTPQELLGLLFLPVRPTGSEPVVVRSRSRVLRRVMRLFSGTVASCKPTLS